MKETIELILFVLLICALCFVFDGDPDLWDKWHEQAMRGGECSAVTENDA